MTYIVRFQEEACVVCYLINSIDWYSSFIQIQINIGNFEIHPRYYISGYFLSLYDFKSAISSLSLTSVYENE